VELLTIHKSKGLQYDTVIVPGLERVGQSDPPRLLQWLKRPERRGGESLLIAPVSATGADERNPLYGWLARLEGEKLLHEKRRLLYVAATRAERALHLLGSCPVETDKKTGEPGIRAPWRSSALGLLWADPRVPAAFAQRLAELGEVAGEDPAEVSAREPLLRRLPAGWTLPDLPPAPRVEMGELPRAVPAEPVEFDWATETARHVGTVVHRELQRLAREGARLPEAGPGLLALAARHATELAELGVPEDRRDAAAQRVLQALQRTLDDERGRWTLAGHRAAQSELALTGRYARSIVSVVVDRTFVAADGVRWIIDYKTSTHEGADVEAFLDNERERYRPQLEKYATLLRPLVSEPVRLGLYFPLLSAWREWEAETPAAGG
jgi:ATP-dependent exoDNAse (exonuclease V) beta subunit